MKLDELRNLFRADGTPADAAEVLTPLDGMTAWLQSLAPDKSDEFRVFAQAYLEYLDTPGAIPPTIAMLSDESDRRVAKKWVDSLEDTRRVARSIIDTPVEGMTVPIPVADASDLKTLQRRHQRALAVLRWNRVRS